MTSQLKTLSGNFQKIDMISCYGRRLSWQANLGKAAMFISGSLLQTFAWVVASPQDMGNTKTANSLLGTLLDFDGYLHWLKTVDLILVGLVLILGFRRNCAAQSNSCGLHWPHQEVLTGDAFLQWPLWTLASLPGVYINMTWIQNFPWVQTYPLQSNTASGSEARVWWVFCAIQAASTSRIWSTTLQHQVAWCWKSKYK